MSWDERIIGAKELSRYFDGGHSDLRALALALIEHQRENWPQLAEGYAALEAIETKPVSVEESEVVIQHNPKRIRSTAASVDKTSVAGRPCFLCAANLPEEEKGIAYGDDLIILCNPFPVLDRHLSIVHREHIEQKIDGNVGTLLDLAHDFGPEFFALYNGPRCGASAPDHLHFQVCSRAVLPIEEHVFDDEPRLAEDCTYCEETARNSFELFTLSGCGRSVVVFRGGNRSELVGWVNEVLHELGQTTDRAEPLVNIVCVYDSKLWTVYMFPRAKHRPASFFADGDERLTVSPGAIDMAGVVVVPERAHFDKIGSEQITRIFAEVSLNRETLNDLIDGMCSLPEAGRAGVVSINQEPLIRVGLMSGDSASRTVKLTLTGRYRAQDGEVLESGDYIASNDAGSIRLAGGSSITTPRLTLTPVDIDTSRATVNGITIGVDFHWQRRESQDFQGSLVFTPQSDRLVVINELPLEAYLVSVISSEMSASAPTELLRAHAIVSRSWLLAQMTSRDSKTRGVFRDAEAAHNLDPETEVIRWWDRENHADFDVCADDHCQRYQGISKAFSREAFEAVRDTRGKVLMWGDAICDARYSKSCGGMTEEFRAAWQDRDVPYLRAAYDGESEVAGYAMPLAVETNAEKWIRSKPPAFCHTDLAELLARILPGFDQETLDFFRWEVGYSNEELSQIILDRTGLDLGRLVSLEAIERGKSARIIRLKIIGETRSIVIGKELQIRRALSRSHLYSSAFVVEAERDSSSGYPKQFKLIGAGWGHGVGLCQIGAAVMAELGHSRERILAHYFNRTSLRKLY